MSDDHYVLAGIQTRFIDQSKPPAYFEFRCPCGYVETRIMGASDEVDFLNVIDLMADLRFHYTHCPDAQVPA